MSYHQQLSDPEYDQLNAFLRVLPHKPAIGMTWLQGFFCALNIAPTFILPSTWFKLILGNDFPPQSDVIEEVCQLMLRFYHVVHCELQTKKAFDCVVWQQSGQRIPYLQATLAQIEPWCQGYLRGFFMDKRWRADKKAIDRMFPMSFLSGQLSLVGIPLDDGTIIEDEKVHKEVYRSILPQRVVEHYQYWKAVRKECATPDFDLSAEADTASDSALLNGKGRVLH